MNYNKVWNSYLVQKEIDKIEIGLEADYSPFYQHDHSFRAPNINFEYSKEEIEEITKCANDVAYFASKYAYGMTDKGITRLELRNYQERIVKSFQDNKYNILLASRQIGKTTMSTIFIAWYICFHTDRNIMIMANKMATATEIVSKVKEIIKCLPFYMKPGLVSGGTVGLKFDNGVRLFSQATTKTAAIGFTIHLLYADEFAHIPDSFIVPFYRSIYPTLSSSEVSKIIITSTPNGMNLFYDIYSRATKKENEYVPLRVDWWEVPGRDENWRKHEISNLGSEELFNQEYGNQFLNVSKLYLGAETLSRLKRGQVEFVHREIDEFEDRQIEEYKYLKWHPKFQLETLKDDFFVLGVDLADGNGGDYSCIQIFRLEPLSILNIRKQRNLTGEESFFRLRQIGIFHSNVASIESVSTILEVLCFSLMDPEKICVSVEHNYYGNYIFLKLEKNRNFFHEILLHTRHSAADKILKPGVKIRKENRDLYLNTMKNLVRQKKIVLEEFSTIHELMNFGLSSKGKLEAITGHDDTVMATCMVTPFFESGEQIETLVGYYMDNHCEPKVRQEIYKQIDAEGVYEDENMESYRIFKDF